MKKTFYLFNPGNLERRDNTLKFTPYTIGDDGRPCAQQPRYIPIEDVGQLYSFGALNVNSALLNFLGQKGVPVHFFDYYENYTGSFMPRDGLLSGRVLLSQAKAYQSKKKRLLLARKFIEGASWNMTMNLNYYNRRGKDLAQAIASIKTLAATLPAAKDVDEVMCIEGNIRRVYYDAFNVIIDDYEMPLRTKQPPENEVNALISFGNMMCYAETLRAVHQTQLNPTISFLHTPGERRYSLCLDISEVFKPVIVDRVIFKVLNKKIIQPAHFNRKMQGCLLNDAGKQLFVRAMEDRYNETFKHRALDRNVSYKHLIKLECYKLVKDVMGMEEYEPFKMYW